MKNKVTQSCRNRKSVEDYFNSALFQDKSLYKYG